MSALAIEIDRTLRVLDKPTAIRFERLVRDAIELVRQGQNQPNETESREDWILRLDELRNSVATGKSGTATESIIDDLRSERN